MAPKLNLNSYAIRNRFLRFGKRYRQLMPTNWHTARSPLLVVITAMVLCTFLIWIVATSFATGDATSSHSPSQNKSSSPLKSAHATQVGSLGNESQIVQSVDSMPQAIISLSSSQIQLNNKQQPESGQHQNRLPPTLGMIYNESDRVKKDAGYTVHAFNTLISERIGLSRPLPDTRNKLCRNQTYSEASLAHLTTSVVICFYNEDYHTLQRTIYSVLERTPDALLQEVILIDDASDNKVGDAIAQYIQSLKANPNDQTRVHQDYLHKVHYYRTPDRAGLVRARVYGTHFATGQVLFFLDSHCEMNQQWLEPLLARIAEDRKRVVCPIIDLIDPDTFGYFSSPIVKGGFNWGLHFKWDSVPSELLQSKADFIKPIKSPTMAGGLFAIERQYFNEMGKYDQGMDIWGGENIEISFRTWMCGGRIEIVPCSRVGHVFRHRRPYGSPEGIDTLAYNSLRVAHVWMDDHKKYFLASRSDLPTMPYGDVQERIDLRHRLNCSTFEWYLRNVYPEMMTPEQEKRHKAEEESVHKLSLFGHKPAKVVDKFAIQLAQTKLCIESESEVTYKGVKLLLKECARSNRRQHWKETSIGDIRLGPKSCLEVVHGKEGIRISKCHEMGSTQQWQHQDKNNTQLYNVGSGLCLAVKSDDSLEDLVKGKLIVDYESNLSLTSSYCSAISNDSKQQSNLWTFTQWNLVPI